MVMTVTGWSLNDANKSDDVPRSRCKHAACLRDGVVYIFGGKDGNIPLNDVWSYDIGTLTVLISEVMNTFIHQRW